MNMILLPVVISVLGVGGIAPATHPGEGPQVPLVFHVENISTDPVDPRPTIRFALPSAGRTRVDIFDGGGRHVCELLDEELPASTHQITWSGTDDQDESVSAGKYFYVVSSGSNCSVGRMALER